ncbi:MAG: MurR/RpiR family transcriptional regulator [Christensenellaceae bacterium]|jgi:DNA-binding MurR/RpiR family transcriptional regulator
MYTGNLLDRLNLKYDTFSKGQKLISEYIMQNYDKAAYMTAAALSKTVGVSESTIVRFAYALGYDGYPKMQKDLQEAIQNRLTSVQRLQFMDGLSTEEIINASFKTDINNLRVTKDKNSPLEIEQAVECIAKARTIYLMGTRSSAPLAEFLAYYLGYVTDNIKKIQFDGSDIFSQVLNADERDVVVAISFPRYSMRTVEGMRHMKDKGCKLVAITDNAGAPPAQLADYALLAKSYMNSFVDSFVAPLSVINLLIIMLGLKHKETLFDNFEKLEALWKENDVYASKEYNRRFEQSNE